MIRRFITIAALALMVPALATTGCEQKTEAQIEAEAAALTASLTGALDEATKEGEKAAEKGAEVAKEGAEKGAEVAKEGAAKVVKVAEVAKPAAAVGDDSKIKGTWSLDTEAMLKDPKFAAMPEEQKAQAAAMVKAMKMDMTFEGGKLTMATSMGGKEMKKEGTYSVTKVEGDSVTIASKVDGRDENLTLKVTGDTLGMTQGGQTMTFKRK